jgi:hypothetical protein
MLPTPQFANPKVSQQKTSPGRSGPRNNPPRLQLPKLLSPDEKALTEAKTRRLNAGAYKDQALGRLADLEGAKLQACKPARKSSKRQ